MLEDLVKQRYHVDHTFVAPNATVALDTLVKMIDPQTIYSPAFTWESLLSVFVGRQVQWLDIDRHTWLPTIPKTEITKDSLTIYNHTFGNIGIPDKLCSSITVFDGAQAFGAEIKEFGDATVFGFAPTKPVTCGEGGMIVTNNTKIAQLLEKQQHILLRMSEFQAAVGLIFLQKLPEVQEGRRKIWDFYNRNLPYQHQEVPFSHSRSVYGILVSEREKLIEKIKNKIETHAYYTPLYQGLSNTDFVAQRILCIPSYADCSYKEVVEIINEAHERIKAPDA